MNKKLNFLLVLSIMISSSTYSAPVVIKNFKEEIDKAPLDPKVNIKIAPLAGDDSMTMYSTVLKPGSKVTAHVHMKGIEIYHILKGTGEIYTGHLQKDQKVIWNDLVLVKEGDVFSITPGTVHQLKNTSPHEDLVLMFVCPLSHLKDDRIITDAFSQAKQG